MSLLHARPEARVLFVLGNNGKPTAHNRLIEDMSSELKQEQDEFADIVFVNYTDSHQLSSEKMVLTYLFLSENKPTLFPSMQWVFKVDQSVYISAPAFYKMWGDVQQHSNERCLIGKSLSKVPVRKEGSMKLFDFHLDVYPTFTFGDAYWMNGQILEWIEYNALNDFFKVFPREDVVLGVWFSGLNVDLINDTRIELPIPLEYLTTSRRFSRRGGTPLAMSLDSSTCNEDRVTFKYQSHQHLQELHDSVVENGNACKALID
jgi:hypothetical protein